ncbi:MAG: HigA family addiction module antidote protein [Thermoflexaceae bacterium]|nr:HigA family addiction module antidote protein [Thermoflexaceae bacterium]
MATEVFAIGPDISPGLAIHPGEVLAEELRARRLTQKALAEALQRPPQAVSEIVNGRKRITAQTALELEQVLGTPARAWLGLQMEYDLVAARIAASRRAG